MYHNTCIHVINTCINLHIDNLKQFKIYIEKNVSINI